LGAERPITAGKKNKQTNANLVYTCVINSNITDYF
jgi:hypothetical protein